MPRKVFRNFSFSKFTESGQDLSRRFFSTFVKKKSLIFIVRATLFVPAKMLEGLGSVIRHFLNLRPAVPVRVRTGIVRSNQR